MYLQRVAFSTGLRINLRKLPMHKKILFLNDYLACQYLIKCFQQSKCLRKTVGRAYK